MAVPANTVQTFDRVANREDLTNDIFRITPEETPFTSNIGRGKAKNIVHDWQTDDLKAADPDNAHVQGDDTSIETAPATTRLQNETQIMKKSISVSGTQQAMDHAGIADQFGYQSAKRAIELRHDMEMRANGNYAAVAATASVAGKLAGFEAWIPAANSNRGVGGAAGTLTGGRVSAAATDGTQRTFTEAMVKDVMQKARVAGGKPTMILMGPKTKQVASGFSGIAEQRRDAGSKAVTIVGAADLYVSDFGTLAFVDNVYQRERSALFVDKSHCKLAMLRPVSTKPLARTGDSRKADMTTEFTLEMCNPSAHGIVADLDD